MKKLIDIPKDKNFTGYYWLSDSDIPVILNDDSMDFGKYENNNPFIQEAYFSDGENSYSIKHFDGKGHIVSMINGKEIKEKTEYKYIADNALVGAGNEVGLSIETLKFIQEWEEREDELCENMKVLKPARIAFSGFNEKEKKND